MRHAGLALSVLLAAAPPLVAEGLPDSPILTLDQERLFSESRFGMRIEAELEAAQQELIAENRQLEARLTEEERRLTERRAVLAPEAFREQADAFDARVEAFRRSQEAKSRALLVHRDTERQRFFEAALPVLAGIVREAGAAAILSDQAIVLSFENIDITDAAIARLDAVFAAEEDGAQEREAPGGRPEDGTPDDGPADDETPDTGGAEGAAPPAPAPPEPEE